jgi:hypothetical protein
MVNTSSIAVRDMVNSSKILLSEQRRPASNITCQNAFSVLQSSVNLSQRKLPDQDSNKESSFQDITYTNISSTNRKSSVLKELGQTIVSFLPEIIIIWPWEKQKEKEKEKKRHLQKREINVEDLPHQDFNELHRIKSDIRQEEKEKEKEKETEKEYEQEQADLEDKNGKKFISLKENIHLPPEVKYDIVNPRLVSILPADSIEFFQFSGICFLRPLIRLPTRDKETSNFHAISQNQLLLTQLPICQATVLLLPSLHPSSSLFLSDLYFPLQNPLRHQ